MKYIRLVALADLFLVVEKKAVTDSNGYIKYGIIKEWLSFTIQ